MSSRGTILRELVKGGRVWGEKCVCTCRDGLDLGTKVGERTGRGSTDTFRREKTRESEAKEGKRYGKGLLKSEIIGKGRD